MGPADLVHRSIPQNRLLLGRSRQSTRAVRMRDYLISAAAPASSSFFLMSSASFFGTPSLTTEGTPSTRSLASFKPEPGEFANNLNHANFVRAEASHGDGEFGLLFSSGSRSSTAASGSDATGAAALTPHFSSSALMRSTTSITLMFDNRVNQFFFTSGHFNYSKKYLMLNIAT